MLEHVLATIGFVATILGFGASIRAVIEKLSELHELNDLRKQVALLRQENINLIGANQTLAAKLEQPPYR